MSKIVEKMIASNGVVFNFAQLPKCANWAVGTFFLYIKELKINLSVDRWITPRKRCYATIHIRKDGEKGEFWNVWTPNFVKKDDFVNAIKELYQKMVDMPYYNEKNEIVYQ